MKLRLWPVFALLPLLLVGCDTFAHRAREKATLFASLSPEQRDKLKHGEIEVGYSPDLVYLALGAPDEKHETTTADLQETVWIYHTYHEEYEGNVRTGVIRHVVYHPTLKRYVVYYEPVYADVYSQQIEENIRIVFRDQKVAVIEHPKRR